MPTLLHLDSSPMGEASVSRHLSALYAARWVTANPDGRVITRDLTKSGLTPVDAAWVAAAYTPKPARTVEQNAVLALSDELIDELVAADEYVIGLPMHNFSVASNFKLWIDVVARSGRTFSYASGAPEGLLKGKKATFAVASAGVYGEGSAMASFDFVKPYVTWIMQFMGVTDVKFVLAGGAGALMHGKDRKEFLQPYEEAVAALFESKE